MAFKDTFKSIALTACGALGIVLLSSCGGGGGGGGGGGSVLYYPYETVYGDLCTTTVPTPGCTFYSDDGTRIDVTEDPHYNYWGGGSDDMSSVDFYTSGGDVYGDIYDNLGVYQGTEHISYFGGWMGGGYIGVGTTGLFWESVSGGTYYFGQEGVLYSANAWAGNFGEAINTDSATEAADTNFAALNSESNKALIKKGAQKLINKYGFQPDKAEVVAAALNRWNVGLFERDISTEKDMDKGFKGTFGGMDFRTATAAVKSYMAGDYDKAKAEVNRSAAAMGLRSDQLLRFMGDAYAKPLTSYGYDAEAIKANLK